MLKKLINFLFCFSSLTAQASVNGGNWDEYFQNSLNETKPRYTLELAQKYFEMEKKSSGLAVDLGTGTGRDALFLLQKGWNVLAIDADPLSIEILLNRADNAQHLEVNVSSFSAMILPENIDFINASFSLPFCAPEDFSECWQRIVDHLAIGGRFAGQLFGDKDAWASDPSRTFHTQEQMLQLFKENFVIEYLQVEEGLFPTRTGPMKHWHVYHVIAKKIK